MNNYKGIDITDLEDTSSKDNVFNISSKLHQWLPNQYGKISLSIKDYIKTTNDNLNLIKNKAGDNQTTLEILVQNGDNIIQDDV